MYRLHATSDNEQTSSRFLVLPIIENKFLLGISFALCTARGKTFSSGQEQYALAHTLYEDIFVTAWTGGQTMTLEQAIS